MGDHWMVQFINEYKQGQRDIIKKHVDYCDRIITCIEQGGSLQEIAQESNSLNDYIKNDLKS